MMVLTVPLMHSVTGFFWAIRPMRGDEANQHGRLRQHVKHQKIENSMWSAPSRWKRRLTSRPDVTKG